MFVIYFCFMNKQVALLFLILPFGIFISTASLKILPEIYWKVSNDLKLNHLTRFTKVGLPLSKRAIGASFMVIFFIAFALSAEVSFLGDSTKISTRGFILSLMSANQYRAIFSLGFALLVAIVILYTLCSFGSKIKSMNPQ